MHMAGGMASDTSTACIPRLRDAAQPLAERLVLGAVLKRSSGKVKDPVVKRLCLRTQH